MHRSIAVALSFAIFAAVRLFAQAPPPISGPSSVAAPKPRNHASPAKAVAPPVPQAILDATSLGSPILLDKNWRVGITSNPAASSAAFDDSTWAIRSAQASMQDVPDEDEPAAPAAQPGHAPAARSNQAGNSRRYAWFRLHIELAPNHGPLALLIELPVSQNASFGINGEGPAPDVFANGTQIQPEGPHASDPERYQQISRIYPLSLDPSVTSLTLVIRNLYISFGYGAYTGFFSNRTLRLGNPDDLQRELNLWSDRNLDERLPRLVYSSVLVVLAVFLLALYFAQKGHPEYLWLALHELVQAPMGFLELADSSAHLDSLWYAALVLQLVLISAYLFFEFLVAFLSLRRRWYIKGLRYTAPILAGVGPVLLLVGHNKAIGVLLACIFLLSFLWMISWSLFTFITLIAAAVRRNFEAGLLLIPLVLSLVGLIEPVVISVLSEETGMSVRSPLTLQAGPIPIHFASFGDFAGILAIVLIIFFRFLRIQREQERATNELSAARSVQELLIPQEKLATPGFEVDSIYSPANEVGGDFFHVQMAEGGMLVVIGDVAGKGLKAAMSVSMLMGALRRVHDRNPARILQALNRVLAGTESFTTCQAIWFGSNGEMVIANAGHLPPYLNSQEIAVPSGLPLGILPDSTSYEEAHFYLHPGDRVLLLSDGVVEARKPSGELFGFDRLGHLSNQSAFYLAEAAKAFGQQDDITVLTVRRQVQVLAA